VLEEAVASRIPAAAASSTGGGGFDPGGSVDRGGRVARALITGLVSGRGCVVGPGRMPNVSRCIPLFVSKIRISGIHQIRISCRIRMADRQFLPYHS
jgi:hypothetical protein